MLGRTGPLSWQEVLGQIIAQPQAARFITSKLWRFFASENPAPQLTAALAGFRSATRQNIRLATGATMTVDLELDIAGLGRSVTVVVSPPIVDVRSAASPTTVDDDLLQNLPMSRTLESIVNLTPGITAGVAFGGAQRSNAFHVDGVNTSEPALGTSFNAMNYNWVEEVQVMAAGAAAEYGEFTGASVNAVVRSGSNRLSGLGEYFAAAASKLKQTLGSLG